MARTTIGNLAAVLTANTSRFDRGMKNAGRQADSFGDRISRLNRRLQIGLVAGATAAGGALALMTKQGAADVDQLAKTAAKLGLTVDALRGLEFAAEKTGVKAETMAMAMQRMTRRVAEAARGTGEAKDALAELGLDAEKLNRLSPDQQFQRIADAMGGVENHADKVRLAMRLFDSEGVALVNTMALGSDGLRKMQRDIIALGGSLDADGVKQVENFNDSMTDIGAVFRGFRQQLAVAFAPALRRVAEGFLKVIKSAGGMKQIAMTIATFVVGAIARAIKVVKVFQAAWHGLRAVVLESVRAMLYGILKVLESASTVAGILEGRKAELPFERAAQAVERMRMGLAESSKEAANLGAELLKWDPDEVTRNFLSRFDDETDSPPVPAPEPDTGNDEMLDKLDEQTELLTDIRNTVNALEPGRLGVQLAKIPQVLDRLTLGRRRLVT